MTRPDNLREHTTRATLLLKDLRSSDPQRQRGAAERLARLPWVHPPTADAVLAKRDVIRRKHALHTVALEAGFESWDALKAHYEANGGGRTRDEILRDLRRWDTEHDGPFALTLAEARVADLRASDFGERDEVELYVSLEDGAAKLALDARFFAGDDTVRAKVEIAHDRRRWTRTLPIETYFARLDALLRERMRVRGDVSEVQVVDQFERFEASFVLHTAEDRLAEAYEVAVRERAEILAAMRATIERTDRVVADLITEFTAGWRPEAGAASKEIDLGGLRERRGPSRARGDVLDEMAEADEEGYSDFHIHLTDLLDAEVTAADVPEQMRVTVEYAPDDLDLDRHADLTFTATPRGTFAVDVALRERRKYWVGALSLDDYLKIAEALLHRGMGTWTAEQVSIERDGDYRTLHYRFDTGEAQLLRAFAVAARDHQRLVEILDAMLDEAARRLGEALAQSA